MGIYGNGSFYDYDNGAGGAAAPTYDPTQTSATYADPGVPDDGGAGGLTPPGGDGGMGSGFGNSPDSIASANAVNGSAGGYGPGDITAQTGLTDPSGIPTDDYTQQQSIASAGAVNHRNPYNPGDIYASAGGYVPTATNPFGTADGNPAGLTPPGAGSVGPPSDPYSNFITGLGKTTQQTYGGGAAGSAGGDPLAAKGFQRIEGTRFVVGPDGDVYVTDPGGYLNPNVQEAKAWQDLGNIQRNAMYNGFAPDAMEKLQYAHDNIARLGGRGGAAAAQAGGPEVGNFFDVMGSSPLGANAFQYTPEYKQWAVNHNAEAQALGIPGQAVAMPVSTLPPERIFPAIGQFMDMLKQAGATNVSWDLDNHMRYQLGTDTPIVKWLDASGKPNSLSGDTPIGKLLQDLAFLREVNQQRAAQAAAAPTYGGYPRSSYPSRGRTPGRGPYGDGSDVTGTAPSYKDLTTSVTDVTGGGPKGGPYIDYGTNKFGETLGGDSFKTLAPMADEFGVPYGKNYVAPADRLRPPGTTVPY